MLAPFRIACAFALLAPAALASPAPSGGTVLETDVVFVVDASRSMADNIAAVASGLSSFAADLGSHGVDPRFAIVLFGLQPEMVLDFTDDVTAVETAFATIDTHGAVPGFQHSHNAPNQDTREAGLEAIRMSLNASTETLFNEYLGGDGRLHYRANASKNLILVTDADSDQPFFASNRFPGETNQNPPGPANFGGGWQDEVDFVAGAAIQEGAFVNMLVKRSGDDARGARNQYGDFHCDASDPDLLHYDPDQTLQCLEGNGWAGSLQAQLLAAGLVGRTFDVLEANSPVFVQNFYAAKLEEIVPPVVSYCMGVACPCGNDDPDAGCRNSTGVGALLVATGSTSAAADDLVLSATQIPPGRFGILFAGPETDCVPWGDGFRAVQPGPPGPMFRLGVQNSGPSGTIARGPGLSAEFPTQFVAGSTWRFQAYYRDDHAPSPCGFHFNLSNAVQVIFAD